jgi:hypothetical protein
MSNSFFDVQQHRSTSNAKFSLPSADVKCVFEQGMMASRPSSWDGKACGLAVCSHSSKYKEMAIITMAL